MVRSSLLSTIAGGRLASFPVPGPKLPGDMIRIRTDEKRAWGDDCEPGVTDLAAIQHSNLHCEEDLEVHPRRDQLDSPCCDE